MVVLGKIMGSAPAGTDDVERVDMGEMIGGDDCRTATRDIVQTIPLRPDQSEHRLGSPGQEAE